MRPPQRPTLDLTFPNTGPATRSTLPDIRTAIAWRDWDDGCRDAAERRLPMLVLAESHWANSAQRIALRLQQDVGLRTLLEERIVPVLVDPDTRPDLVAEWRHASVALTGTAGPPLIVLLTHEALPFLSYCTMQVEGDDIYPSLTSLIESISERYPEDADTLAQEARERSRAASLESPVRAEEMGWDGLRQHLDSLHGGLDEMPKHPRPALLWSLLEAHDAGDLRDDIVAWLRTTLHALVRGGTWDQIDRGFHRCARDERWTIPHFEKPIPLNAQLTAVYARAAKTLGDDRLRDVASRLASFSATAMLEGVDIIAADTGYYTWTSKEILNTLEPSLVQVITLHYDLKPVHERQALRRVVEMEQMDRFSHEDINVLRTRLARGRAQLRAARLRRPAPETISLASPGHRATTIQWLLMASRWLDSIDVEATVEALDQLIDGRFDASRGYTRTGDDTVWLEDQAALLAAFIEAHSAAGDQHWLDHAAALADILLTSWWSDAGWLDRPGATTPSHAVVDDVLPSTLGTLGGALRNLGEITGHAPYAERATVT